MSVVRAANSDSAGGSASAKRQVQIAVRVDLGHDGDDRDTVVDERDVVAHLEVLVAIECELMDDGAPIDDRVELDRDLGSQMPNRAHAGIAGFEAT